MATEVALFNALAIIYSSDANRRLTQSVTSKVPPSFMEVNQEGSKRARVEDWKRLPLESAHQLEQWYRSKLGTNLPATSTGDLDERTSAYANRQMLRSSSSTGLVQNAARRIAPQENRVLFETPSTALQATEDEIHSTSLMSAPSPDSQHGWQAQPSVPYKAPLRIDGRSANEHPNSGELDSTPDPAPGDTPAGTRSVLDTPSVEARNYGGGKIRTRRREKMGGSWEKYF